MPDEDVPVLIVGGSLVGLTTAMLLGHHGVPSLSVERHRRHRDPSARRPLPAADDGAAARSSGSRSACARSRCETLQPDGRHHRGRVARRPRARHLRQGAQRGRRGVQPDRARLHQPGRARAAAARARASSSARRCATATEAVALEQDDDGVTVTLARPRRRATSAQVRARYVVAADGNRSPMRARLGIAMRGYGELSREHHDLLPRRLRRAAARPQPGRDLRAQPRAARVLPARPDRRHRLPRHQHGRRGRHAGRRGRRAGGPDRGARARVPAHGDRRPTCRWRSWTSPPGSAEANCAERLPRRPRVPRRRRRPRRPAQRRLRRQHRRPGRAQPRLEARGGRQGRGRRRRCSTPTRPSACRSAS